MVKRKTSKLGGPDKHRVKDELEEFPLDALRMVGTVRRDNHLWALIASNTGNVYRVREGNHMGQNYGKIVKVTPKQLELIEMVPDEENDGWSKRNVTIDLSSLQDKHEKQDY